MLRGNCRVIGVVLALAAGIAWAGDNDSEAPDGSPIDISAVRAADAARGDVKTASPPATQVAGSQPATQPDDGGYFEVYINDKDNKDDDEFSGGVDSKVTVVLHGHSDTDKVVYFRLSQRPLDGEASIKFIDKDGAQIGEDHVYPIHYGESVVIKATADKAGGTVEITASDVTDERPRGMEQVMGWLVKFAAKATKWQATAVPRQAKAK